jgi:hypothetical protein
LAAHPQVRDRPISVFFLKNNMPLSFQPLRSASGAQRRNVGSIPLFIPAKRRPDQINSINGRRGGDRKNLLKRQGAGTKNFRRPVFI